MGAISKAVNNNQQAPATQNDGGERKDPARALISKMQPAIEKALPKHIGAERFARIALTTLKTTPKLAKCMASEHGQMTFLGALMQCAQLGLEPGPLGHAYILPFWNKKKRSMEAQFVPGYKGLIDLCRRSGHMEVIYAHPVYAKDKFECTYGIGGTLVHEPDHWADDRGELLGFYAYAELDGGAYQYLAMSKAEVNRIRDTYSQSADSSFSPWNTEYEQMGQKTVLKRLTKMLPVSVEYANATKADEQIVLLNAEGELVEATPEIEERVRSAQEIAESAPKTKKLEGEPDQVIDRDETREKMAAHAERQQKQDEEAVEKAKASKAPEPSAPRGQDTPDLVEMKNQTLSFIAQSCDGQFQKAAIKHAKNADEDVYKAWISANDGVIEDAAVGFGKRCIEAAEKEAGGEADGEEPKQAGDFSHYEKWKSGRRSIGQYLGHCESLMEDHKTFFLEALARKHDVPSIENISTDAIEEEANALGRQSAKDDSREDYIFEMIATHIPESERADLPLF